MCFKNKVFVIVFLADFFGNHDEIASLNLGCVTKQKSAGKVHDVLQNIGQFIEQLLLQEIDISMTFS